MRFMMILTMMPKILQSWAGQRSSTLRTLMRVSAGPLTHLQLLQLQWSLENFSVTILELQCLCTPWLRTLTRVSASPIVASKPRTLT